MAAGRLDTLLDSFRLAQSSAILLVPRAALHLPRVGSLTAGSGAHTPGASLPLGISKLCFTRAAHDAVIGRQSRDLIIALWRLLAHHLAIRLGALLRLLALPVADWLRAHGLALQSVVAQESALGLLASSVALGPLAIQGLAPLADVFRAEHSALGSGTLHLARVQMLRGQLGASRLALGPVALGLAILLADWLRAVPCAVRHAAVALVIRHQLAVLALGLHRDMRGGPSRVHRNVSLQHCGTCRGGVALLCRSRVPVEGLLLGQGDRDPDVGDLGSHIVQVHATVSIRARVDVDVAAKDPDGGHSGSKAHFQHHDGWFVGLSFGQSFSNRGREFPPTKLSA
mmetsp:Transcript_5489/g.12073  ORF Transcript_5489/g.12073 Transcript_5489/m.12073 type:complete len:342 (-) Transcript_5489:15-1040(-)